jgi:hypothetical protein
MTRLLPRNQRVSTVERGGGRLAVFGDRLWRTPRGLDNLAEPATRHFEISQGGKSQQTGIGRTRLPVCL